MTTSPLDPAGDPERPTSVRRGLDPAHDPDRFDASREPEVPELLRGLDPRYDPDRFDSTAGKNLTDLVGKEGAFEEERDGQTWVYGLLLVFGFLAVVALLFQYVLVP